MRRSRLIAAVGVTVAILTSLLISPSPSFAGQPAPEVRSAELSHLQQVASRASSRSTNPVMGSLMSIIRITHHKDRSFTVTVRKKRAIPELAAVSLSWKYSSASRSTYPYSRKSIWGKKGKASYKISAPPRKLMVVRIVTELHLPEINETSSRYFLNARGRYSRAHVVSTEEAVVNRVASHVPGLVLSFAPQGRALKIAGRLILGWQVFSDVKASLSSSANKACPRLRAGQVVRYTHWTSLSRGRTAAKANIRYQIWRSKEQYSDHRKPACSAIFSHLYR